MSKDLKSVHIALLMRSRIMTKQLSFLIMLNFLGMPLVNAAILNIAPFHQPIKVSDSRLVAGGGYGGNKLTGLLEYDGSMPDKPSFLVARDAKQEICYLNNDDIYVATDDGNQWPLAQYACPQSDAAHHDTYWNGYYGSVNGGYSPYNDIMVNSAIVRNMLKDWYGFEIKFKTNEGYKKQLNFILNSDYGYLNWGYSWGEVYHFVGGWETKQLYPATTLDAIAYLIGYDISYQLNGLHQTSHQYDTVMEAVNYFLPKVAEYYYTGQSNWTWGSTLAKSGQPLIYYKQPSLDCGNSFPGDNCSIDDVSYYRSELDSIYASGIYRRFFYLLSQTKNWDIKKTFALVLQAYKYHWTPSMNLTTSACGLLAAAKDLQYPRKDVAKALKMLSFKLDKCE